MQDMTILGVVEQAAEGYATVRVLRRSACGTACGNCAGCDLARVTVVKNDAGAVKGDNVVIGMGQNHVLLLAFVTYILPIIMLFIGYAIAGWACAFAFFAAPFVIIKLCDKRMRNVFEGRVQRVIRKDEMGDLMGDL